MPEEKPEKGIKRQSHVESWKGKEEKITPRSGRKRERGTITGVSFQEEHHSCHGA